MSNNINVSNKKRGESTKKIKSIKKVELHVRGKSNNCFLTLTQNGNTIKSLSFGHLKDVKGSKKKPLYALESLFDKMMDFITSISIDEFFIQLHNTSIPSTIIPKLDRISGKVLGIQSRVDVPHGGVRLRREKRK